LRGCKALGIKGHPARFPAKLPEFFIKYLTTPGDLVIDIFAGSNTTGRVAESLERRWLSYDLSREYLAGSTFRFLEDASNAELKAVFNQIMEGGPAELRPKQKAFALDAAE
jgi:site-specific DNA-methyltransferase (cytosine-N4-specific)